MSALNDAATEAIEIGNLGHLATTNPVGSSQKSAVLVGPECDEIVAAHLGEYQNVRLEGAPASMSAKSSMVAAT